MAHHFDADTEVPLLHEPLAEDEISTVEPWSGEILPSMLMHTNSSNSNSSDSNQHLSKNERDCIVDITEENQNQDMAKHYISRVNSALFKTKSDAYKPKLISIGPYHMEEPGLENSVKQDFQKSLFGKIDGLKEHCTKKLMELKDKARSWYAEDTKHMNDDQFVDMLLLDGCFILELFEKCQTGEDDAFMKVDGNVAQSSSDMILFENQLPFFVLFELFKLKCRYGGHALPNDNDDALLEDLIDSVKRFFMSDVPKLTPKNVVAHEYKPDDLPKHLIQVVHSLCIPRNAKCGSDNSGGLLEQVNTATELEKDGVSFKKIGKVYTGYYDKGPNFNANDGTTLFDLDFSEGILKIPCFKIDDYTETFLRNMIAYEQHSTDPPRYFTDFAWFMDQLIDSTADVKLLRRRGIIVNMLATDNMVTKMFDNLCERVISYGNFSGVINKVNRHGDKAWNIWIGKLRQDLFYSPWKLISTVAGGLIVTLGTAVSVKSLLK